MKYDLIVVGAGISGLSFAHLAAEAGWRTRVLEAGARAGGALHTLRTDDGFWLELGAHTLFNSYGGLIAQLGPGGVREHLLNRLRLPYRIAADGELLSIRSQLYLSELLRGLFVAPRLDKRRLVAADYYGRLAGRRNWGRVVGPALDAVTCQGAGEIPAHLLFRKRPRRPDFPRSFSLTGGLSTITDGLAGGLDLTTRAPVTRLSRRDERFVVEVGNGELQADRVALAVPPAEAARLLEELAPRSAALLAQIGGVEVESLGVVVRADRVRLPRIAGLIGRDQPFFSVVSRDVIADAQLRGFTFHFRPGRLDAEGRREAAGRLLGVASEGWAASAETTHRLPAPRPGHEQLIADIDLALPPWIILTGNYFGGLSIEECVTRSREQFDRVFGQ